MDESSNTQYSPGQGSTHPWHMYVWFSFQMFGCFGNTPYQRKFSDPLTMIKFPQKIKLRRHPYLPLSHSHTKQSWCKPFTTLSCWQKIVAVHHFKCIISNDSLQLIRWQECSPDDLKLLVNLENERMPISRILWSFLCAFQSDFEGSKTAVLTPVTL